VLSGNQTEQREQQQKHFKSLVMRASNEMMEKLIAGGAEINCVRSDGLTPLMLALSKVGNAFVTNADQGTAMIVCAGITDQWVCMGNTMNALAINYLINEM